jgi:hypothetical protein
MKQQFVITHQYTVLQQTEKALQILNLSVLYYHENIKTNSFLQANLF